MPGAAVADAAENFNRLTEHVDELKPNQVEHEISTMLGGDLVWQSPLIRMMVRHEVEPDASIDPMIGLLQSVGSAIDRSGDAKVKNNLGGAAVEAVSHALADEDFAPTSYASVMGLADQAEKFAELQTDPYAKAWALMHLAKALSKSDLSAADDLETSVFWRVSDYLDEAAELAGQIEDPSERFYTYKSLGERSAAAIFAARIDMDAYEDGALTNRMTEQIVPFFKRAQGASRHIENLAERTKADSELVYSITAAGAKVRTINPETSEWLTALSLTEFDALLREYSDGDFAGMKPAEKARGLSALGGQLASVISSEYKEPSHTQQREQLIDATIEAFQASLDYARQVPKPTVGVFWGHDELSKTGHAMQAARQLIDLDFEAAKELISIGFNLGATRDGLIRGFKEKPSIHYVGRVADKVSNLAMSRSDAAEAFDLYALIHKLETSRLGDEAEPSMIMEHNARRTLFITSRSQAAELKPDENGRALIEFAIMKVADNRGNAEQLEALKEFLGSDPGLQRTIQDRIDSIHRANEEAKAPNSETERLAQELADSL